MRTRWAKQKGFTIVELLIVIVIIGILAALVITAYNGIQVRAENTKTITAVKEYAKGLRLYASDSGTYPVAGWSCLGAHPGTTCSGVSTCNGNGQVYSTLVFDTAMKTVFKGTMPQPSDQKMNCGGNLYGGAYYYSATGTSVDLRYILRGNQPCAEIGGVTPGLRYQLDDATLCYNSLPLP